MSTKKIQLIDSIGYLSYNEQTLTDDQRAQAMANILPAVTSDDNGKFMTVVDGAWAAEAIPNAEEASF